MSISTTDAARRVAGLAHKIRTKGLGGAYCAVVRRIPPWEEWTRDRYFDWKFGISTAGEIPSEGLDSPSADYHHSAPSYYGSVHKSLDALPLRAGCDVLVDFGSGKGRVLVVAARYPFRKIIGVECAGQLTDVAWQNITRARRWMQCQDIDIVTTNAAGYDIPDAATVLYFQNPFSGDVVDAVLTRIKASLARAPRTISLISYSHDPAYRFEQQIRACDWLRLVTEVRLQRGTRAWIYANTEGSAGRISE